MIDLVGEVTFREVWLGKCLFGWGSARLVGEVTYRGSGGSRATDFESGIAHSGGLESGGLETLPISDLESHTLGV